MRKKLFITIISFLFLLISCNKDKTIENNTVNNIISDTVNTNGDDYMKKELGLMIDGIDISVSWIDNESVKELKELAKNELVINMNMYNDFEQYGSIGKRITSKDVSLTTNPGDIVLYTSNQIVLFYGSNTWSYTKLGHMNLNLDELYQILGKKDVVIKIYLK